MPTLCALRRRGYTPSAILDFVQRAGIAKANSLVDIKLLEHCIREELNETALRRMAVTEPVKLVITNYPEGQCEEFEVPNNPRNEEAGNRKVPFTRELYIEKSDFAEVPPPKFQRLKPDGEVRLMGAYIVKCNEIVKDDNGEIVEIRCTADLETRNACRWTAARSRAPFTGYLPSTPSTRTCICTIICLPSRTLMTYRRARIIWITSIRIRSRS